MYVAVYCVHQSLESFAPDMASKTSYDKEYFHAKRREGDKEKRKKSIFRRYLVHVMSLTSVHAHEVDGHSDPHPLLPPRHHTNGQAPDSASSKLSFTSTGSTTNH